eukprot:SM007436S21898  [mRNA]  locus=s7436:203:729:+ [translate_table: standard]
MEHIKCLRACIRSLQASTDEQLGRTADLQQAAQASSAQHAEEVEMLRLQQVALDVELDALRQTCAGLEGGLQAVQVEKKELEEA